MQGHDSGGKSRNTSEGKKNQGFRGVRILERELFLKPSNTALPTPTQQFAEPFGKALSFCVSLFENGMAVYAILYAVSGRETSVNIWKAE